MVDLREWDAAEVLDALGTAVLEVSADLVIVAMNAAAEELFSLSTGRAAGKRLVDLVDIPSTVSARLHESAVGGHPLIEREVEIHPRHGESQIADVRAAPLTDNSLLLEIGSLERQRRIAREDAMLAQSESSRLLLRGLAHEVKNPLGGLRGAAQLLERELDNAELREYTRIIIGEADRLQRLIDRLSGPTDQPNRVSLNLHEVTEYVLPLLDAEAPSEVVIRRDYDPSLPEMVGDRDRAWLADSAIADRTARRVDRVPLGTGRYGFLSLPTPGRRRMSSDSIWVVDDDRSIRWVLTRAFEKVGISVREFESGEDVIDQLDAVTQLPDAIITDVRMPGMDGISFMRTLQGMHSHLPVIVMTAHSDLDSAVNAYEGGAFDYLPKPFDIDAAVELAQRAAAHGRESRQSSARVVPENDNLIGIIGAATAMQDVFRAIGRLSRSHITVLINGESGTGKELIAKALHRHSPRAANPFIALNMAAIPRELMESELFGHERGAFTGAQTQRTGRFEQANGGTLFLDEIGDMPSDLQTRLLRVLSDGEFFRVGGSRPLQSDVRIVAATHQDLEERVRELGVTQKIPTDAVVEFLATLPWPGNVRQLENTAHWLTVMASGRELHLADLPDALREPAEESVTASGEWTALLKQWAELALANGESGLMPDATKALERCLIGVALNATGGRRQDAARLLGWGRNTLTRKISELGI